MSRGSFGFLYVYFWMRASVGKIGKGMIENEYLHRAYNIFDEDMVETSQKHLLIREDIHSHSSVAWNSGHLLTN